MTRRPPGGARSSSPPGRRRIGAAAPAGGVRRRVSGAARRSAQPARGAVGSEATARRGPPWGRRRGRVRMRLELLQVEREPADGAVRFHERQRDDRLAGPAREVVDVEREPRRQQDDLRRQRRHPIPGPQPEERQPQMGEDARAGDSALLEDELGSRRACARPRAHPPPDAAPSRPRSSWRGRRGPRGSSPTSRRPAAGSGSRRRCARSRRAADAEELAQQHVLRVHRDVRLQLAPPPAGLALQRKQVLASRLERQPSLATGLQGQLRHAGKLT